jgi:RND family efflux transporter MFP subunit
MKKSGFTVGIVAVAIVAAGGGYWFGSHGGPATATQTATADVAKSTRKLLYYRNPMGLPDTSPVPKKDPMGMDYIAVYEGEEGDEPAAAGSLKLSTEKIQKLGVRSEAAQMRAIGQMVRAVGRVEPDERRLYTIAPKFEGYVERLHVNVTGQAVSKGQLLFEVYSPELVSAQREYAIAMQGVDSLKDADGTTQAGMRQLAESAQARLKNWDVSPAQLKALSGSGQARRTLSFGSPVSGIVTEKKAVQGMRFMPGEALYQVADLSAVWVIAEVAEQDIGRVNTGDKASVRINAYPDKVFEGKVAYVYPTLKAETRSVPVRIELANPGLLLKPAMFAQVELPGGNAGNVLTVPTSAVIDSGTRRVVLVRLDEGRFEPREVRLGARSDSYVEVIDGVKDGEQVVVSANFLIDAESNLKAALGGFSSTPAPAKTIGHQAEGSVDSIDAKAGTLMLSHAPVASLKWPAMTMEFKVANDGLLQGLKPGAAISFEFVERQPGEWVVTAIKPAGEKPAAHAGH